MKIVSTSTMLARLEQRLESNDLEDDEKAFVRQAHSYQAAGQVTALSDEEVERLSDLHERLFQ